MATQILLPLNFTGQCSHSFVGNIVLADQAPVDDHINFNFANLRFIDGVGLTILCNTIEWLLKRQVRCTFSDFREGSQPVIYLDDCGFFAHYLRAPLRAASHVRQTTVPLTKISYAESHGWLDLRATPWLSDALVVPEHALGTIRACIKEVFNNVADHSTEDIACVHMQHYPNKSQVQITISDFGLGIPANIAKSYKVQNDVHAINLATNEGVTSKSHPNNRGAGLKTLIDCVTMNGGHVNICSMKGRLTCYRNAAEQVVKHAELFAGIYPGTLVNIILKTNLFVGDDNEEVNFEW